MHFLYPSFLFSLLVLALPVIIHLFYFRRFKQVLFSNIRYLRLIKNEKQSKNNLKHLILLMIRMLALACLVFAFSQPYIPVKNNIIKSGKKAISIYIDNSMSMENLGINGTLLDNARKIAAEIVKANDINDQYQIITNDLEARQQRFYDRETALRLINETSISPFASKLSDMYRIQSANLDDANKLNRIMYVLSDMQKSYADFDQITPDSSISSYLIPLTATSQNNISIDSAWFDKPIKRLNQQAILNVALTNYSDKSIEGAVLVLKINGIQKALSNYNLASDQSVTIQMPFTITQPGWNKMLLSIDDYPLSFDDHYYGSFFVKDKVNILCINSSGVSNPYLRAVFATDDYFSYEQANIADYSSIRPDKYQLLILNEPLKTDAGLISVLIEYVAKGGNLLLIPSSVQVAAESYNSLLNNFGMPGFEKIEMSEVRVHQLNTGGEFFRDVFSKTSNNTDLPYVKKYYARALQSYSTQTDLILLDNKQALLSSISYQKGNVFVLSVPVNTDWSNFPKHALFLPVMYQVALKHQSNIPLSFSLIQNKGIVTGDLPFDNKTLVTAVTENGSFIPDQKVINGQLHLFTDANFNKPGFYSLSNTAVANPSSPVLAFNFHGNESNTACYSQSELKKYSDHLGFKLVKGKNNDARVIIEKIQSGKSLWKIFAITAILLLITEILLIRFWKS